MVRNQKPTGRAASMPVGLINGAGISLGITILGSAVIAKMLDMRKMDEKMIGYAVMIMLMTASFLGAMVSRNRIKRQHLLVCCLAGVIYLLELLGITALFFGGQYEAIGVTMSVVFGGSMLALLCGGRSSGAGRRRKTVSANR